MTLTFHWTYSNGGYGDSGYGFLGSLARSSVDRRASRADLPTGSGGGRLRVADLGQTTGREAIHRVDHLPSFGAFGMMQPLAGPGESPARRQSVHVDAEARPRYRCYSLQEVLAFGLADAFCRDTSAVDHRGPKHGGFLDDVLQLLDLNPHPFEGHGRGPAVADDLSDPLGESFVLEIRTSSTRCRSQIARREPLPPRTRSPWMTLPCFRGSSSANPTGTHRSEGLLNISRTTSSPASPAP